MFRRRRNPKGGRRMVGAVRELAKAQGWRCPLCGGALRDGRPFNIDHIRPKAKGGSNSRRNRQVVHMACNTRKADRWDGRSGHAVGRYSEAYA